MNKIYLTVLLLLSAFVVSATPQDSVTLKLSSDELIELLKLKKELNRDAEFENYVNSANLKDSLFKDANKNDKINLWILKQNRGKGYGKQPFEDKNKYALLEKGVSYVSFNVGFISNDINDFLLEPVAVVDKLYNRNISASISAGHLIANNTAINVKFAYSFSDMRLKMSADILDIIISAKTYETNNVRSRYHGSVGVKNFIPLDAAQRFFIVSETNLGYTYTDGLSKNYYDNGVRVTKVKTDKDAVSIGVCPGFMYFMSRGFAFEFGLSPVLVYWERTKTVNNEVANGSSTNYGLSFKFMPLNIKFGFSYYFGLDYDKNRAHVKKLNIY